MGKKISKKQREDAATICSIIACSVGSINLDEAAAAIGCDQRPVDTALDVSFDEEWYRYASFRERWASADSALRTGWSPS